MRTTIALSFTLGVFTAALGLAQQPGPASLSFTPPTGWIRSDDPSRGLTALVPAGLPRGAVCLVTILPPQQFPGNADELHAAVMRLATSNGRLLDTPQRAALGRFQSSTFRQLTPQGVVLVTTIYTARWADRGQAVLFASNNDVVARTYRPAVESMIGRVDVPAANEPAPVAASPAAPRSNNDNAYHPATVAPADRAIPIIGSFISAAPRSSYSVGSGVSSNVQTIMLVLFGNGVAARALVMKDGSIDANYLAEGFATLDPSDPSKLGMRLAGKWKEQSGKISISWANGESMDLTRDGPNLKERYVTWTPYASVDGLRLDGRFERVAPFGSPWAITLHKDGTFTEDLAGETMGGTIVNPAFPEHGSGTYEIRRWSLILRFGSGFVQSINLLMGEGEPANASVIVLNGFDFRRTTRR
jgi:hypothetical protein